MASSLLLAACSTNPATGDSQFTALMSPAQEEKVGAQEHQNIIKTMGVYDDQRLQAYVNDIGQKLAANTERPDVEYNFTVIDSPIVNAFALPGGYVYVSRGLLALANNETELAGVIGHEIGHITARHSAERFSQGMLATLGTAALSIALDSPDLSKVAGLGSELYLKSYSRGQEHEADTLGIRYLHRAAYDPHGMASFLAHMDGNAKLQAQIEGRNNDGYSYFSTHPRTEDRTAQASAEAAQYAANDYSPDRSYLDRIDGLTYGDSADHGFARGQDFYHPPMGFTFSVPQGFHIYNSTDKVTALSKDGESVIVFDAASRAQGMDARQYLTGVWMKGEPLNGVEKITINGMNAATASFAGRVDNKAMTLRIVAVEWAPERFFRFQMAMPQNASNALIEDMKRATYSLRPMSAQEKQTIEPYKLRIVTAKENDSVKSLAAQFPYNDYREERFRVLNGMKAGEGLMPGFRYKIVTD